MSTPHGHFSVLRAKVRVGLLIEGGALAAAALLGYLVVTYGLDSNLRLERSFRMLLLVGFLVWLGMLCYRRVLRPMRVDLSDDEMALAVERRVPQMKQELISAVEFERALVAGVPTVESRELMSSVVSEVHARVAEIPFHRALERSRVQKFGAMMVGTVLAIGGWAVLDGENLKIWAMRNLGLSAVEWPRLTHLAFLGLEDAGLRRHPQGDDLTLLVTAGESLMPEQVFLNYEFAGGDSGTEPMTMLGDARFTITLPTVLEDLTVWATGGDGLSEEVTISVVERPRIEELQVELVFPAYMGADPVAQRAEADIKVPRGGGVRLRGRSTKPIESAFAIFDQDVRQEMEVGDDGHSFRTQFMPDDTGLLVLDVLDRDQLGTGKPPRLFLRITEDEPPAVEIRAERIGSLVTTIARIPGIFRVQDDYGLVAWEPSFRITRVDADDPDAPEPPFEPAEVTFVDELPAGVVAHESNWLLDLRPLNPDDDPDSLANKIHIGDQVSLRFSATDNFGPAEPHVTLSEVLTFQVVTRQKLLEDLARRQMEERRELIAIRDEERAARNELEEIVSPAADDPRAVQARIRVQALSRDQKSLGDRVGGVGERYGRILDEMENNRVFDVPQVRSIREKIVVPLAFLAREDFPTTSLAVGDFAASGQEELRTSIVESYDAILERIELILENMQDVESLAAILETLREVITDEENVMAEVRKRQEEAIEKLLGPGKTRKDKDGKGKDGKDR